MLTKEELELTRQWFDAVLDLNAPYLEKADYALALKIYALLGVRVPNDLQKRAKSGGLGS